MARPQLNWTDEAQRDFHRAITWYRKEFSAHTADRFIDTVYDLELSIQDHPALGSRRFAPRAAHHVLRFRKVAGFPYLVFYVEHENHIEIWRLLHESRDIPKHLQETPAVGDENEVAAGEE